MVVLRDRDVVSVADAWGSFQRLGCMCVTHRPCGGWGLDLGQMTHPDLVLVSGSRESLCSHKSYYLGLVVHHVLECLHLRICFVPVWRGLKQNIVSGTLTWSYVYVLSDCLLSMSNSSCLGVTWKTSTAAVILGFCFTVGAHGFTILCSKRAFFCLLCFH